jgi:ABC-2 type transport system ATP-binding protein
MAGVIEARGLTRRFGDRLAVDALDLHVERGEIYAFLGLNGAGKTTTIRMLLGMIRPSAGEVALLGERVGPDGRGPWARVGHLVESATAYPGLTVRENLRVFARLHGRAGAVDGAIERLGLAPYADRRAGALSLGNLQRLALARALLHTPELLVLDEPGNALDPAGAVEVREMLRGLARDEGTTVFLSSHLLAEVDRLATHIGIIRDGRMVEELDAAAMESRRGRRLRVDARDRGAARRALEAAGHRPADGAEGALLLDDPRAVAAPDEVARILVGAGVPPTLLVVEQEDLETHFLRRVGAA